MPTLADYARMVGELAGAGELAVDAWSEPHPESLPIGYLKRLLVSRLLSDVADAGGRLTLDKNAGGGSLLQALNLLAAYTPPDIKIGKISASTLNRWKADWTKLQNEIAKKRVRVCRCGSEARRCDARGARQS